MLQIGDIKGDITPLTDEDYAAIAKRLGIEPAVAMAVKQIESAGKGFLPDGRPITLFEAYTFGKLTGFKYNGVRDSHGRAISSSKWDRSLYGASGAWQYERIRRAMELDPDAALKATSWGLFQILGSNYKAAGFNNVEDYVRAISKNEDGQLEAFANFVEANGLKDELQSKKWASFAKQYNGPGYAANKYDTKMAAAYAKLAKEWAEKMAQHNDDIDVNDEPLADTPAVDKVSTIIMSRTRMKTLQTLLNILKVVTPSLNPDGWYGDKTGKAIAAFQTENGLHVTYKPNIETLEKLGM